MLTASTPLLMKLVSGVASLTMNFAMRHVVQDVSPMQQKLMQSAGFKCVALFAMFYVSTRDIIVALILTAVTIVLMRHLLHEQSPLCIIPGCVGGISTATSMARFPHDSLIRGPAAGGIITQELYNAALAVVGNGPPPPAMMLPMM